MAVWLDSVIGEEHQLLPGHAACAGCGPAITVRHLLGALAEATPGAHTVLVIPASCWTVIAGIWPVTAFRLAVHLTPFASAAAEAAGIRAALRLQGHGATNVVVWGGHGSTFDIGFAGVSTAAERNEDIIYVLNDNEAYMNTGVQKSGACPPGWRYPTEQTVEVTRLAVESRTFPLLACDSGEWPITYRPRHEVPVCEYLAAPGRFAHLSPAEVAAIQAHVDERWELLAGLESQGREPMRAGR